MGIGKYYLELLKEFTNSFRKNETPCIYEGNWLTIKNYFFFYLYALFSKTNRFGVIKERAINWPPCVSVGSIRIMFITSTFFILKTQVWFVQNLLLILLQWNIYEIIITHCNDILQVSFALMLFHFADV